MKGPALSVVIVSFRCREYLAACLASLRGVTSVPLEAIVVDNASDDGTTRDLPERFPEVKWLFNQENRGFAAACNQGLILAKGRLLWLLNADTEVTDEAVLAMVRAFDDQTIGIAGARQVCADGSFQSACRRRAPTPLRAVRHFLGRRDANGYEFADTAIEADVDVEAVSGATLMFRRELFQAIGFLDEGFFFMGEDLDFCYRGRQAGFRVRYVGSARILHHYGGSRKRLRWRVLLERHRAMWRYFRKHLAPNSPVAVRALVYGGIAARLVGMGLVSLFRDLEAA